MQPRIVADDPPGSVAVQSAQRTLNLEERAVGALRAAIGEEPLRGAFAAAADLVFRSVGRVIATGMGKSGLVARRLSATLASTGTPSFFLHPAEASHGDLGMVTRQDVLLALSWSGETAELSDLVTHCARIGVPLLGVTASSHSTLARCATVALVMPQVQEACPNNLAPTSSCAVQSALGDALSVALLEMRGFSADDFHVFHPRGQLGARLTKVADLMNVGDALPSVAAETSLADAILEMSSKRLGVAAILDEGGRLLGAFTDGDLRRSVVGLDLREPVREHMTPRPITIAPDRLAADALATMNEHGVLQLFVCRPDRMLIGVLHMHDVIRAGVS